MSDMAQLFERLARLDEAMIYRRQQTEQDVARVQADLKQLREDFKKDFDELKAQVLNPLVKDVREVRDSMLYARGGWKVLLALGGLGAAVGAMLAKVPWDKLLTKWSS